MLKHKPRIKGTTGTKYYEFPKPVGANGEVARLFRHSDLSFVRADPKHGIDLFFVERSGKEHEDISIIDIPQLPTGSCEISEDAFIEAVG